MKAVEYHSNGKVKFPATWVELVRECERLKAKVNELQEACKIKDAQINKG